jgi:uncharacterized protein YycO
MSLYKTTELAYKLKQLGCCNHSLKIEDDKMKTLTALALATTLVVGVAAPVQANSIADTLSENISKQLTGLSSNIKQQANVALKKTMAELFFTSGIAQAEHAVATSAADNSATQTSAEKE